MNLPDSVAASGSPAGAHTPRRVLVVDDDPHIREVVRFALQQSSFEVHEAADGASALEQAAAVDPDLVVLDILMPEMDGTEVCRRLRAAPRSAAPANSSAHAGETRRSGVPIIFLSSKSDEIDRVVGLELGGDDYVTKPFSPRELVARVRAVLRRVDESRASAEAAATRTVKRHGGLHLDPDRFEVSWNGQGIVLTLTEFGLLETLMSRPGKVFGRDELMHRAYRDHVVVSDRTINSHIKRLRRKLASVGCEPIETVHGLGYRLAGTEPGPTDESSTEAEAE